MIDRMLASFPRWILCVHGCQPKCGVPSEPGSDTATQSRALSQLLVLRLRSSSGSHLEGLYQARSGVLATGMESRGGPGEPVAPWGGGHQH